MNNQQDEKIKAIIFEKNNQLKKYAIAFRNQEKKYNLKINAINIKDINNIVEEHNYAKIAINFL